MKITVQEKIAELESRVAALERERYGSKFTVMSGMESKEFESHWRALWREFDAAMKSLFKRTAM